VHNIGIKRYCDKNIKIFFNQYFFSQCELKIFILGQLCLLKSRLKKNLKCLINILTKMSFYLFIAIFVVEIHTIFAGFKNHENQTAKNHANFIEF